MVIVIPSLYWLLLPWLAPSWLVVIMIEATSHILLLTLSLSVCALGYEFGKYDYLDYSRFIIINPVSLKIGLYWL